jgi:hypothetical protein
MIWLSIAVIISITPFKIIMNLIGRGKYNCVIHDVMLSSVARSKQSDTGCNRNLFYGVAYPLCFQKYKIKVYIPSVNNSYVAIVHCSYMFWLLQIDCHQTVY